MAQSVKRLTLDFNSGHYLMVRGFEPCVSAESAWDSQFSSLSPLPCSLPISLSLFKINKFQKKVGRIGIVVAEKKKISLGFCV